MVLLFASRANRSRSSPKRAGEIRTVTTKFCGGALMVSEKWSQVISASRQLSGFDAVKGPPDQLTLGVADDTAAPAGVEPDSAAGHNNVTAKRQILENMPMVDRPAHCVLIGILLESEWHEMAV